MDKMNQLRDLLKHQIEDLYSAEEQIIEALPSMIEKAKDRQLKKALEDHLRITQVHKERLDDIMSLLDQEPARKSFLPGLFGSKKCRG
jgi:ferritin-like metal-binding protein YciE